MALRDAQKTDKKRRILEAARGEFIRNGFDRATIRAIARDAGVGLGTVILYGETKHALLQEVWSEEVSDTVAIACVRSKRLGLISGAMALFEPMLRLYADRPALARVVVKELPWLEGAAAESHRADLLRYFAALEAVIKRASRRGDVARDVAPARVAEMFFSLYYGACLRLLMPLGEPDVNRVIRGLDGALTLLKKGLGSKGK